MVAECETLSRVDFEPFISPSPAVLSPRLVIPYLFISEALAKGSWHLLHIIVFRVFISFRRSCMKKYSHYSFYNTKSTIIIICKKTNFYSSAACKSYLGHFFLFYCQTFGLFLDRMQLLLRLNYNFIV